MKTVILVITLCLSSLYADYTNISISDYVNIVATQNKINIATDNYIKKDFNFYINKPIGGSTNLKVLRELLDSNGYTLVRKSKNYYVIKNKKNLLINKIKIYNIKYADTKKLKEKMDLILKGYFKNTKKIKTSQSKKNFTPMQERKDTDNNSNITTTETEQKIDYSINALNNKSIAVTYKDNFVPQVVSSIIRSVDIPRKRINVKMKIYEVSTNALKEFSNKLTLEMQAGGLKIGGSSSSTDGVVDLGLKYANGATNAITSFNLGTVLTALEKQGKAKVTSQPNIYLYEGHSSKLVEGKTFPVQQDSTTVSNNNTTTSTTYIDKNTGLTLDIKFNEFRSGMINMSLKLDISSVENYDPKDKQLITTKRSLQTDMIIDPGELVNMAGLTSAVHSKSEGGIPLLMDIPIIGKLFTFKKNIDDKNILIIELMAELVNEKSKNI